MKNLTVSRFRISKLHNEEWFRFHTELITLLIACGVEILELVRIFPLYEALYKEADRLLEMLRLSFATVDTTTADNNRSAMYRSLRNITKSLLSALDPAERVAATKVYAVIEKYNSSITRKSLSARTAAIDNLLQDLTQEGGDINLSAEVQLLELSKWTNNLQTTNEAYKQSLAERTEEGA
ncbi:MAG: DUF6261 family protein, partial [Tannerellaceae bacterium]|nr:DUF6261 family protein [Tannerellaceae bacterium]